MTSKKRATPVLDLRQEVATYRSSRHLVFTRRSKKDLLLGAAVGKAAALWGTEVLSLPAGQLRSLAATLARPVLELGPGLDLAMTLMAKGWASMLHPAFSLYDRVLRESATSVWTGFRIWIL